MTATEVTGEAPATRTVDPLYRMAAYHLALSVSASAWNDAIQLDKCRITRTIAGQLYRASGSIAANLAEGYSRASPADRARLFEYALGSARECRVWYELARPVLGTERVAERESILNRIVHILLAVIPRERRRRIASGKS